MVEFKYEGTACRLYMEGDIITGNPQEYDILLTHDSKIKIYENSRWNEAKFANGQVDYDKLMEFATGKKQTKVVLEYITHPDTDPESVKAKQAVWDKF